MKYSSFILKKIPKTFTRADIFYFYGIDKGHEPDEYAKLSFIEFIENFIKEGTKDPNAHFLKDYFKTKNKEGLMRLYGDQYKDGYGKEVIDDIMDHPEDYFEFIIYEDDPNERPPKSLRDILDQIANACRESWKWRAGKAYKGSFITKNGLEIYCD